MMLFIIGGLLLLTIVVLSVVIKELFERIHNLELFCVLANNKLHIGQTVMDGTCDMYIDQILDVYKEEPYPNTY